MSFQARAPRLRGENLCTRVAILSFYTPSVAEQGRLYNRQAGKAAEGEGVSDGSEVAMKRGNACGAKGPCCL